MSRLCFLLVWLGAGAFAWGASNGEAARSEQPTTRVVRQYALTSANDFPQRDPRDWRLLGSNDGGRTWTALDVQKGELFSERHQRRVFKLANQRAYSVYRLQIDRVRDPAAGEPVQLAEIEPLGATENDLEPAPLMEDLITAQGENAPWETCRQAFDGRIETKWLDPVSKNSATRTSWIQWQYTSPADLVITNVSRLLGLRNRADRSYFVRIVGVLAGRLAGTNEWCLFDGSGALAVADLPSPKPLFAGQRILLEGRTQWTNGVVEIGERRLRQLGGTATEKPRRIAPEQPLAPENDLQWVEAEGRIQFCSWTENHWVFDLEDNARSLSVHVLRSDPALRPPLVGAHVIVKGICGALLNREGESVAAVLWVPTVDAIQPVTPAGAWTNSPVNPRAAVVGSSDAAPLLTSIEQIRQLSPEELLRRPKVKVRGIVTELFGLFIQDETAGVEVWYRDQAGLTVPAFRSCVQIEGRGDWSRGHGPIIRPESIVLLGPGKLPEPERSTWSQLAGGRMVDQWVEIEAVVRSTDGSHLLLNSEGGQLMATIRAAPAPTVRQLVDATVRIRGVCVAATDSRGRMQGVQLLVPSLESVEVAQEPADPFSLPVRPIGSLLQVRGPGEFVHRVRVEGVLTHRDDRTYFVQDATGAAMAIAQKDVILTTSATGWNWMFRQGASTSPAPGDELQLKPGDHLQVVGFPEMRGYSPILTEVLVRKVSGTNSVAPVNATVEDIDHGGLDAALVSLEAVVLQHQTLGRHFVLELQSGQRVFQAFLPALGSPALDVGPGSKVRVTGACQVEPSPYRELGWRVASFKLLVGSLRDVVVLERPSWWTLKHALAVMGVLLLVLASAGAWIGILHRQVGKRTRQLRQEVAEHEKTESRLAEETQRLQQEIEERKVLNAELTEKKGSLEQEIEKRRQAQAEVEKIHRQLLSASRLAGMADVATNVLHNVGNVLNSVNVQASTIVGSTQRSKAPGVARVAALLAQHQADLGRFLTQDENGKHVPGLLERLGAHLMDEQKRLVEMAESLTENIQHLKEVVAMQQNYARVAGVTETIALTEVVEDALRMCNPSLARHQIEVIREFVELPPVTLDRHKVLQILFNLLDNAKHACEARGAGGRVTVRIRKPAPGRLQVQVIDNGIGIPEANLPGIFTQGFSTRKHGHGFGLHSSILAAQDMGGFLTVESEGPGTGATFTLTLPESGEKPSTKAS